MIRLFWLAKSEMAIKEAVFILFFAMLLVTTDVNQRDESEGKYLCIVNVFFLDKQTGNCILFAQLL